MRRRRRRRRKRVLTKSPTSRQQSSNDVHVSVQEHPVMGFSSPHSPKHESATGARPHCSQAWEVE